MNALVHVRPNALGWSVYNDDSPTPRSTHRDLDDAIYIARDLARQENALLVVHDEHGNAHYTEPFSGRAVPPPN